MEIQFTAEQETWRQEVKAFLDAELPPDYEFQGGFSENEDDWAFAAEFWKKVGAKGWIALTWPKQYNGLDRPPIDRWIMMDEFQHHGAYGYNGLGETFAMHVLRLGTEEQKQRWVPGVAAAEDLWAEGYTEPNSGSDLASLTPAPCVTATSGSSTAARPLGRWRTTATGCSSPPAPIPTPPNTPASATSGLNSTRRA